MLTEKFWVHTLSKGLILFYAKEPYPQLGISVELQRKHIIPSLPSLIISHDWQFITMLDPLTVSYNLAICNFKKLFFTNLLSLQLGCELLEGKSHILHYFDFHIL